MRLIANHFLGRPSMGALLLALGLPGTAVAATNQADATAEPLAIGYVMRQNDRDKTASEWVIAGGNHSQFQFSQLDRINDTNVNKLGLAWVADLPVVEGLVGSPLVRDGLVFQGAPGGRIVANDVRTGKLAWLFEPEVPDRTNYSLVSLWATRVNRGLAIDETNAFIPSGDCRLFAVNLKTGKQSWEAQICDPTKDYGNVAAPRIGGGMVFIGNSNGEFGTQRTSIDAFDAATGRHVWRFYTTPGDPSKGFENDAMKMASTTWGKEYWKKGVGGAAPWESMTYDEELGLLYIGIGNPSPLDPRARLPDAGDELFSNSILALDARTGKYVWHYKETGEDGFDGDAMGTLTPVDLEIKGQSRRVLIQAAKNGFFYVIDAKSGKFISAEKYIPNNWADHVDPKTGRMIMRPEMKYWDNPEKTYINQPGWMGARSFTAMAYNPSLKLVFIPSFIWPTKIDPAVGNMSSGDGDIYYGTRAGEEYRTKGQLIAWDPIAQKERWHVDHLLPMNGGVLSTEGNLVFQGTVDGTFNAYAAETGKLLWSFNVHGSILAPPITVDVDGEQFVLVPVGDGTATTAANTYQRLVRNPLEKSPSRLLAFKLGGTGTIAPSPVAPFPRPSLPRQPDADAKRGERVFTQQACWLCHGHSAEKRGSGIPDLRQASSNSLNSLDAIVVKGAFIQSGMPAFPHLKANEVKDIRAFIVNEAWTAYDAEQKKNPKQVTGSKGAKP
jgi:quinohemoprotein ethanol dehydrogenase